MKELHPVQQQLLDKFGLKHQMDKLNEEMQELSNELDYFAYAFSRKHIFEDLKVKKGERYKESRVLLENFYREFLDVRNLMQQIESKLDPKLLEKYEAEMFEKAKKKYLDKGV